MTRTAISLSLLFLLSGSTLAGGQPVTAVGKQGMAEEAGGPGNLQNKGRPLTDYLNPDGTLALPPEGIEGSIDPSGFRMASMPGETPRFELADNRAGLISGDDDYWDSRFTPRGVSGRVNALLWDGTNLYAAGEFATAGGVAANHIAKWDGSTWSALGSGMNDTVFALAWDGSHLYAGGTFTTAGGVPVDRIAKWDGSAWSRLGSGYYSGDAVYAFAWDGANLYVGGSFWIIGGVIANSIAKWDGSAWSPLDSGLNGTVYALAWNGTGLYVGGYITAASGMSTNNIAKWNGNAWSALGSGVNNYVYALAWDGTNLYAGGTFTTAGGASASRFAIWDGNAWSAQGSGMNSYVEALIWDGTSLYAGGRFSTADGVFALRIAKWNGNAWSALGSGMDEDVYAMTGDGTCLFAGGTFTTAGGVIASNIAKWDSIDWSAIPASGSGANSDVYALAWDGDNLYIGGDFTAVGGVMANHIAKWDGSVWSALGSGVSSNVNAIVSNGANLYVGGSFITAGGVSAKRIAMWNGSAWSALGSGMNSNVDILLWNGTTLYAGGSFTTAGGISANRIAKWNGSVWSALGSGMSGSYDYVWALAWDGNNLYAGGRFEAAGGFIVSNIAKWNGSAWSSLGSGVNSIVNDLVWDGANLYACGYFTTAGGMEAMRLARWDGSNWSALGAGIGYYVMTLAWDGVFLYAGGSFTTAGGIAANRIAKWNGIGWNTLGSGMNGVVDALAIGGTSLYAGGIFTTSGGKPSSYIARWAIPPCSAPSTPSPISAVDADMCSYTGVSLTWPADVADWGDGGAGTRTYDVLRDGANIGNGLAYGTTQYPDTTGVNGTPYSYAVRYLNGCGRHATTAGAIAADLSNAPGTPVITGISDVNACAQSGVQVNYSPGSGAVRHDLYQDGLLVVTGYVSGATYNPGDTGNHTYAVRAVNADCVKDSLDQLYSDHTAPSPTITGPTPACSPATLSTQAFTSYQWYRNGFIIYGATNQTYEAVVPGTYAVRVTDSFACQATSSGFVINPSPSTPAIAGPNTGCSATGVSLSTGTYASYQWIKDGVDIPGATAQSTSAMQSGTYRVRVSNAAGCTATSAGHSLTIANNPQPAISGDQVNSCPAVSVTLSTGAFAAIQWYFNGTPISGATAQTYQAGVTGNYSVHVVDASGCSGQSAEYLVFIDFCPTTEVSPAAAIFPLRISKSAASGTGYYLFFQRVDSTDGVNIYEGALVSPWDGQYHHAGQPGSVCNAATTDLGTGEMRAELAPSEGNRYYLVTAYGSGAEGPSGFDSSGLEIPASQSTCMP